MQLGERIHLVGSGSFGFDLTDPYPADYRLEPCAVDEGLGEGGLSFLLEHGGRRSLFAGDVVFRGGTILLQNIHDCSLEQLVRSLRKLRGLAIDALLPGHLAVSRARSASHRARERGPRHAARAAAGRAGLVTLVSAWRRG